MQRRLYLQFTLVIFLWVVIKLFGSEYVFAQNDSKQKEPIVSEIVIQIEGMAGDTSSLTEMAREMIFLRPGERFSTRKFKNSIESLKQSRAFQNIDISDPDWTRSEITLTFRLTPFRRIKEVKINGAFPIFERDILNAMTLFPGRVFVPKKLPEQEKALLQLFVAQGYIDPKIGVTVEEDPEDGHYVMYVNVDKENFYRVDRVEIEGNQAFSNSRLKMGLQTWHSSLLFGDGNRFVQKDLDEDVKKLTEFYRKKGYGDVEVKPEILKGSDNKRVTIRIIIIEGPKYEIAFEGNKEFWRYTLKKDITIYKKGNKGGVGLRKSIRTIRDRYRKSGYSEVRVKMEEEEVDRKLSRNILIRIDEGPRSITESIKLVGNKAFGDKKIKKQMLTRTPGLIEDGEFVPKILEEDKQAIKSLYLKHGYGSTVTKDEVKWREVEKKEKKLADVTLEINEGIQTRVSSVTFEGLNILSESEALDALALKKGEPYREYMVKSDENTLSALISENGYPHVKIKGTATITGDEAGVAIIYDVDEGPYVETGQVWFVGNFRTKERVLRNEIDLKPDEPFSLTRMLKSHKEIRNINALNNAYFKPLGLKEKAEKVNLLVEVEERKPYFFEVGGGYETSKGGFVHSKIGDRNLLGQNIDAWINGEYSQIGYRAEMGITEPRVLGSRISSTSNIFLEEKEEKNQDFGTQIYGATLGFKRQFLNKRLSADLGFRFEDREQYRTDGTPIPPGKEDQYEPRSIFVTTPTLVYNSTDSLIRPKKGLFAKFSLDYSSGLDNSLDDFFRYRAEIRKFYSPLERLTFALRGRYGHIAPYGTNNTIPEDQLFFLGGIADVRGFDENKLLFDNQGNALGGQTEILGSLEARIGLERNFELITFYDTGSVKDTVIAMGSDDFRSSVGLGLAYITPIGPIGLYYGHKLDKKETESSGNFYFSIGYTF